MNSVLPIYYQIKETIKGWIIKKEFKRGTKIPSKNGLAERFNVNRGSFGYAVSNLDNFFSLFGKRGLIRIYPSFWRGGRRKKF